MMPNDFCTWLGIPFTEEKVSRSHKRLNPPDFNFPADVVKHLETYLRGLFEDAFGERKPNELQVNNWFIISNLFRYGCYTDDPNPDESDDGDDESLDSDASALRGIGDPIFFRKKTMVTESSKTENEEVSGEEDCGDEDVGEGEVEEEAHSDLAIAQSVKGNEGGRTKSDAKSKTSRKARGRNEFDDEAGSKTERSQKRRIAEPKRSSGSGSGSLAEQDLTVKMNETRLLQRFERQLSQSRLTTRPPQYVPIKFSVDENYWFNCEQVGCEVPVSFLPLFIIYKIK